MTVKRDQCLPTITYDDAMQLKIKTSGGRLVQVKSCTPQIFLALCKQAVRTVRDPWSLAVALAQLDFKNAVDKWYALGLLLEAGAKPFWTSNPPD